MSRCITCTKANATANRLANIERVREYDRQRSSLAHRVEKRAQVYAVWKARHPDRRRAQILLGNAVACKRVIPWPCCALPECNKKPEAHHFDYSMPLSVTWLCRAHHMQAHAIKI